MALRSRWNCWSITAKIIGKYINHVQSKDYWFYHSLFKCVIVDRDGIQPECDRIGHVGWQRSIQKIKKKKYIALKILINIPKFSSFYLVCVIKKFQKYFTIFLLKEKFQSNETRKINWTQLALFSTFTQSQMLVCCLLGDRRERDLSHTNLKKNFLEHNILSFLWKFIFHIIHQFTFNCWIIWDSLVAQLVKNPPVLQETPVCIPGLGGIAGEGIGYPL